MRKCLHSVVMLVVALVSVLLLASCGLPNPRVKPAPEQDFVFPEEAARRDLPEFLRVDNFTYFGFKNEQEMSQVTFGAPYQVYGLTAKAIQRYRPGQSLDTLLTSSSALEFPLLVNGEPRGFLGLTRVSGQWKAHSIGALPTSQQLARWQEQGGNENLPRKLLKIPPLDAEFVVVDTPGHERLVPLTGVKGFAESPDQIMLHPYTLEELMPKLAAVAQR